MNQPNERKEYGVYISSLLSKKIVLKITEIGRNIKQNLENKIKYGIEGKCIAEGYIRPKSVEIVSYSCGLVKDDHIEFQVIYKCLVCNPINGFEVNCVVKNITKAGVHAEVKDDKNNVPITIFIARDHNYKNYMFDNVQTAFDENTAENEMKLRVKIIGVRFELNDPFITAIAYLLDNREKPKMANVFEEEQPQKIDDIKQVEDQYLKLKEEAEEKLAEEKRLKEYFGETGPVVYDEDILKTTKKRKIIIRK